MTDSQQRWDLVGAAITARMDELGLTKAEMTRASGVTFRPLSDYMAGAPIRRKDKARGVCTALGWTIDSIARILDGDEPVLVDAPTETEAAIRNDPHLSPAAKRQLLAAYAAERA